MVEIVNIQEMEGTLVLHIQQWNHGFHPRAAAQKMVLDNINERVELCRDLALAASKPWAIRLPTRISF